MKTLIENFSNQLTEGLEIGDSTEIIPAKEEINNVVISGLGGSGIGGALVSQLTLNQARCPIVANNDYSLPDFVNKNTLGNVVDSGETWVRGGRGGVAK